MAKPKLSETLTERDVARAVAGGEPPEWLVVHFRHWAPAIMIQRSIAAMAFTRTDARERLTNIDRAAEILISAVAYAPSRELLERTDLGAIPGPASSCWRSEEFRVGRCPLYSRQAS